MSTFCRACVNGILHGIRAAGTYVVVAPMVSLVVMLLWHPGALSRLHTSNDGNYLLDAKVFLTNVYNTVFNTREGNAILVGWCAFGFALSFVWTILVSWFEPPVPRKTKAA